MITNKEKIFQSTSGMRTVNLIGIYFLNVLTSKKFLLEIENINGTNSGSDYTIDHKGEFDLIFF